MAASAAHVRCAARRSTLAHDRVVWIWCPYGLLSSATHVWANLKSNE